MSKRNIADRMFHSKIHGYKVFGIFLICFSLIFIPYGTYKAIDRFLFLQRATKIDGQIVDFVSRTYHETGNITFSPIVQFLDSSGEQRVYIPETSFSASSIKQRNTFPIYVTFQPNYEVVLDDFFEVWGIICITLGISFVSLMLGIYLLKSKRPTLAFD